MEIACPHCSKSIELKGIHPGSYAPKCPKCGKPFALVVPEGDGPWKIGTLESAPAAKTTRPEQPPADATMPSAPPAPKPADMTMPTAAPTDAPTDATMPSAAPADATMPSSAERTAPSSAQRSTQMLSPVERGDDGSIDIPKRLDGYEIVKQLGRGGMGAVYLARQVSLDRDVAVKVMNAQWAANPLFVSRFTREAYAAAQLVHHNVVQIYDIGCEQNVNYFSMEFVPGTSIGGLVKEKGRIGAEEAVGYVLQAARGLKFAHDRGMIHRDIKPDNLMLNTEGIVKVADLGLVKTPGSVEAEEQAEAGGSIEMSDRAKQLTGIDVTTAGQAMGTPAYMPPEQAANAAGVDARADIYSLGCTLYVMTTGRPVFEGKTAVEVMTKHQTEAVVRPDVVVKRVPKVLADIIMKMVAKRVEDRFASMAEVIQSLEQYLGVDSAGPFSPREEHAAALEEAVEQFNKSKAAALRRRVIAAFVAIGLLGVVLLPIFGHVQMGGAMVGLVLLTSLFYFVLSGIAGKTHLFRKARQLIFGASIGDWLMTLLGVVVFIGLLVVFNLLWLWVGVGVVSIALAAGMTFGIDRMVAKDRAYPLGQMRDMLKSMRLHGLEEDALRQFICKFGGEHWEGLFEALFGYEAKIKAREKWGRNDQGRMRKRYGAWRDPVIEWIDGREQAKKQKRERKHLEAIERKALKAKGASDAEAQKQAQAAANVMVRQAAEAQATEITLASTPGTPGDTAPPRQGKSFAELMAEEYDESAAAQRDKARRRSMNAPSGFLNFFLGARARFIVGMLLIAGCVLWMHQNNLLQRGEQIDVQAVAELRDTAGGNTEPLRFPGLPPSIAALFNSINPGIAGLVLVLFAPFRGVKMALFVIPAVIVILFGQSWGIPAVWKVPAEWMSLAAGGAILFAGLLFGRRKRL